MLMSLSLLLHSASLMVSSLADLVEEQSKYSRGGVSEHGRFSPPRTQDQVLQ